MCAACKILRAGCCFSTGSRKVTPFLEFRYKKFSIGRRGAVDDFRQSPPRSLAPRERAVLRASAEDWLSGSFLIVPTNQSVADCRYGFFC
jgi:hypothetical protein